MLLYNKLSKQSAEPTYRENRYNGDKNIWFGRIQTCDYAKFVLKSQHDQSEISLSAYVVPKICEPLQHQFISHTQQSCDLLRNLNLADCLTGIDNSEVDVLLGCDQYWDLVTGEFKKGGNGPTTISTRLG